VPNGIIRTNREIVKKERAAYLTLRMTLIPDALVSTVVRHFRFLFFHRIWLYICALLSVLGIVYASTVSLEGVTEFITPANILAYMPLALFSCIVHELGHASACEKFGIKAGSIGFGFYLLIPVFYADVSNAWSLSARKRIIINIAGMYFQLLLSCILVVIYLLTSNKWMLYASLVNIISFLPNLNPFVRYDGYWILSDLLGMNNIMQKAERSFNRAMAWLPGKTKGEFPIKTAEEKFLVFYFLVNKVMVVMLLSVFVIFNGDSVLNFSARFFKFISSLIMQPELLSFNMIKTFIVENLVAIIFYILLFRFIRKMLSIKKARRESKGN
jgi:putative peptide zinc metalloprotease protein